MTHGESTIVDDVPDAAAGTWAARLVQRFASVSVAWKWSLAIAFITIGGMAVFGFVILQYQTRMFTEQIRHFGATLAGQLAEAGKEPLLADDRLQLQVLVSNIANVEGILGALIITTTGSVAAQEGVNPLATDPELAAADLFGDAPRLHHWQTRFASGAPLTATLLTAPMRFNDIRVGHVLLAFDHRLLTETRSRYLTVIVVTTLLMVTLGALASVYLGRRMVQPIQLLQQASRAFGEGRFSFRIDAQRGDEFGELMEAMNTMADGLLEKGKVEEALKRYVSEGVAMQVMRDIGTPDMTGRHVDGSVLFADVSGYTALSEALPSQELSRLLNTYFGLIDRAAKLYDGMTDKFIGDCVMLVFGITEPDPRHRRNALSCATLIRDAITRLNSLRTARGEATIEFHIGVNAGEMLAGNLGSAQRMEYTVVGDSVNIASRLCSAAGPGEIAITTVLATDPEICDLFRLETRDRLLLRGKLQSAVIYHVGDTLEPLYSEQRRLIEQLLQEEALEA
jgi:adenylate cyclase